MPAPRPRTSADPRPLRIFVHLARIASATTDVRGPAHSALRRDLRQLEQESERELPRPAVALALVDEVMTGLAGVVSTETGVLLHAAREDARCARADLHVVERADGEVSEAG